MEPMVRKVTLSEIPLKDIYVGMPVMSMATGNSGYVSSINGGKGFIIIDWHYSYPNGDQRFAYPFNDYWEMIVVEKSTGSEFVKIVGKIDKDIIEKWCKTNCESYFKLSKADENEKCYYVRFESTRDAALFKLFWG
jgi:hypothetical protein